MVVIEPIRVGDLQAIFTLLEENGLPREGLAGHLETILVAREGKVVVGSAALELYGGAALLRSVVVDRRLRGGGLGRRLVKATLDLASKRGVTVVYLLTEGASGFFERLGFRSVSRREVEQAAPAVSHSVEFTIACPESAQVMVLQQ